MLPTDMKAGLQSAEEDRLRKKTEDLEQQLRVLEEQLSILTTLKEVNFYMGTALQMQEMIHTLNDVVLGVLGVSASVVALNHEGVSQVTEASIFGSSRVVFREETLAELHHLVEVNNGHYVHRNMASQPFADFSHGSLAAYRISRNALNYGVVAVYYESEDALTEPILEFFLLISTQLGILLENAYLFQKVSLLSRTDGLTGLYNRAWLNEVLSSSEYLQAEDIGIIMCDIDRFKLVNDEYGHLFGDVVIKQIAQIIKDVSKANDLLAFRYGGEELIIVSKGLNIQMLRQFAEDIRMRFWAYDFMVNDRVVHFTTSVGVSRMVDSTYVIEPMKLIHLADEALYGAKEAGRNRVVCATGDILLYRNAKTSIEMMLAKYKRFKQPFTLLKVKINLDKCCPQSEYDSRLKDVCRKFRLYDYALTNNSGDVLIIFDTPISLETLKKKIENNEVRIVSHLVVESESPDLSLMFRIHE